MIHILANAPQSNGGTVMVFKLTAPTDDLDGSIGERIPERIVQLGLGGKVFRALGYRWMGGQVKNGNHEMWYAPVERNRFKDGALYYEVSFGRDKQIERVRQLSNEINTGEGIVAALVSPVIEKKRKGEPS